MGLLVTSRNALKRLNCFKRHYYALGRYYPLTLPLILSPERLANTD